MSEFLVVVREGGALVILAFLVWWLTRRLNGKIDALIEVTKENTQAVSKHTSALEGVLVRWGPTRSS